MYGAAPTMTLLAPALSAGSAKRKRGRSSALMDRFVYIFKRGGLFFSEDASWQQRLVYKVLFVSFFVATVVVLFAKVLTPVCDDPTRESRGIAYTNPHYRPGCRDERYASLLFLTPRECDLGRRMAFAILCGGTVGYERRRADRPAGIRTMALVALGACIFTITSIFAFHDGPMSWDSSRVSAAIPSGVGFLGAGLIWKNKVRAAAAEGEQNKGGPAEYQEVHGLTTATSTWVAASLGIAAGGGLYFVGIFGVMTLLFVLRFGPRTISLADENHHHDDDNDDDDVDEHKKINKGDDGAPLDDDAEAGGASTPTQQRPHPTRASSIRASSDKLRRGASSGVYHP